MSANAGWYPDPTTAHGFRYWSGWGWTHHVSDHGAHTESVLSTEWPPPEGQPVSPSMPAEPTRPLGPPVAQLPSGVIGPETPPPSGMVPPPPFVAGPHGWHPDPFGRYQDRYFVHGDPTKLVRSDGVEATDPQGATASVEFSAALAETPSLAFAETNDSGVESTLPIGSDVTEATLRPAAVSVAGAPAEEKQVRDEPVRQLRSDRIEAADVLDATASLRPGPAFAGENPRGELGSVVRSDANQARVSPESVASLSVAAVPVKPYEGHGERTLHDERNETESTAPQTSAAPRSTAGARPEQKQPQAPVRTARLRRRRLVFVVLGILVAVGLALGGVKLFRSSHSTPPNEKFLSMVGEIAKVSSNSPSVAGQQKALLNERKHACRTNSGATVAALARRAYVLEHSTNANRRALGAGYLAAVTVSCPAKKQSFEAALAVVAARKT